METTPLLPCAQADAPPAVPHRAGAVRLTVTFCAAFFCLGVLQSSIGPTLPDLERQTNSTATAVAFVFTTRGAGYMAGSLVSGWGMDSLPSMWLLNAVVAGAAVATGLFANMFSLVALLSMAAVQGLFLGAIEAITSVMLIRLQRGPHVGSYIQLLHASFGIGSVAGPLLVLPFISEPDATTPNPLVIWTFWIVCVSCAPACLLITYEAIVKRYPQLARVEWLGNSVAPEAHKNPHVLSGSGAVRYVTISFTMIFLAVYGGSEVAFGSYIYTFAIDSGVLVASNDAAVILTSVFYAAFTIGRLLGVPLVRWIRTSWLVTGNMVIGTLASSTLLLLTLEFARSGDMSTASAFMWLGTVIVGLAMGSTYPGGFAIAEEWTDVDGPATSLFIVGACAGVMIVPVLMGALLESVGPVSVSIIVACGCMLSAIVQIVLQIWLHRLVKHVKLDETYSSGTIN